MANILLTGATGNIGSRLTEVLLAKGVDFTIMTRNADKASEFESRGIKTHRGDFLDMDSLSHAMEGARTLFLLTPVSDQQEEMAGNALEVARGSGIKYIVRISAAGASTDSPVILTRQHGIIEDAIRASGLDYTILGPHSYFQNFLGSIPTIRRGQLFWTTGDQVIPFIDTRDVGDVAAEVLTGKGHKGKTYILTGPEAIPAARVAQAIGDAIGKEIQYFNVPFDAARQAMVESGFPGWLADDLVLMQKFWSDGNGVEVSTDVEEILGHKGRTAEDFARDHAALFQG